MADVTQILTAIEQGDTTRRRASCSRSSTTSCGSSPPPGWPDEKPGQTLQPTALVHEAYSGSSATTSPWNGRGHLFAPPPRPCAASWSMLPRP